MNSGKFRDYPKEFLPPLFQNPCINFIFGLAKLLFPLPGSAFLVSEESWVPPTPASEPRGVYSDLTIKLLTQES